MHKPMQLLLVLALALAASVPVTRAQPEFRSFDGTGVRPTNSQCGAAFTALHQEMSATSFEDGVQQPWAGPEPREVSNRLFSGSAEDLRSLSDMHMFFGQFIAHEVVHSGPPLEGGEPLHIPVPAGDVWFDPLGTGEAVIPFTRSETMGDAPGTRRRVINRATAWIDGSAIYGSTESRAQALRNDTHPEYMAVSYYEYGTLPPLNTKGLIMENEAHRVPESELFAMGDPRGNENPVLIAIHTIFLREHNRWVNELRESNPEWDSERLFHEARRRVIAIQQSIFLNEYIPATVGTPLPLYDPSMFSTTSPCGTGDFYATSAFRYGHSETNSVLYRLDTQDFLLPNILLRDAFFNPRLVEEYPIDVLFRGAARQKQQNVDTLIVDDLRNFLFGIPGSGGLDLTSINIMRNRDHGIAFYNDAREVHIPCANTHTHTLSTLSTHTHTHSHT
eukprot:TRINITY_DN503_c0_g1_i3.p1 TRINITY_DN503_c0_g1~~TRINITY_DN503_c0_g1_i3.p1  ORF type:complete len:447 (+),score=118.39 TRINITY_DN503_c0_g1_i3:181-1521(+)